MGHRGHVYAITRVGGVMINFLDFPWWLTMNWVIKSGLQYAERAHTFDEF